MQKIFVIEDDKTISLYIKKILEEENYQVDIDNFGINIIDNIDQSNFNLIILDLVLPNIDGSEILRQIRKKYTPEILPIIILSGIDDEKIIADNLQLGANDFITKPFSKLILKTKVNILIQSQLNYVERNHLLQIIKEKEQKFHNLADNISDLLWTTDLNFNIIYLSPSVKNVLGFEIEDYMNRKFEDNYPEKYVTRIRKILKHELNLNRKGLVNKERTVKIEVQHYTKEGGIKWVLMNVAFFRDENGNPIGLQGVTHDITNWKNFENSLKESEEQFRNLAESTSVAIMMYQDNKWIYSNPAGKKISGYSIDELKQMNFWDIVAPEYIDIVKRNGINRQKRKDNADKNYEFKIITKEGKEKWVYLYGTSVTIGGKPAGMISVVDIDNLKETESKLREREGQFRAITESAKDAIIMTDSNDKITFWNPAAEIILGYSKEEIIGKNLHLIISPPRYHKKSTEEFNRFQETGIGNYINKTVVFEALRKDGEEIAVELSLSAVKLGDNWNSIGILRDITDRKKHEEEIFSLNKKLLTTTSALRNSNVQLLEAKKKAEESDRLKSAFLANMSHEIRTPMNAIIGFSGLLKKQTNTKKEIKKYSDIIINSGNHLLNLINDIIDISMIDAGQMKVNIQPTDINSIMVDLYSLFNYHQNKNANVKLKMNIQDKDICVLTDETRLRQVLINLLGNATKFTSEGEIEFGYNTNKDHMLFYVKDTGIGIDKAKHKEIFERFRQASNSIEKLYGGTGLGLAISKACVEILGGDIWLESEPNVGTQFYFTIKGEECDINLLDQVNLDIEEIFFNGEKVLLAEDNDNNYEYLKLTLEQYNLKICRTENGKETLQKVLSDHSIDFVIMDIQLPLLNGWEVTKELRKHKIDIPIVAQTAYAFDSDRTKSFKAGCNDYIAKPINPVDLIRILFKYLGN